MAKLLFLKDIDIARSTLVGIVPDGSTEARADQFTAKTITTAEYTAFANGEKKFTVTNGNIVWSDEDFVVNSKDELDNYISLAKRTANECKEKYPSKASAIDTYVSQLDSIDTSSISYPTANSVIKEISSRCANFKNFLELNTEFA